MAGNTRSTRWYGFKFDEAKPVLSPAYIFGNEDEAQLRTAYMPKYGVQPLDAG